MGVFLDAFFLQILEHFSSTPINPSPHLGGGGSEGGMGGVGGRVVCS